MRRTADLAQAVARAMRRTADLARAITTPPAKRSLPPSDLAGVGDAWGVVVTRKDGSVKERMEIVRGEPRRGDSA